MHDTIFLYSPTGFDGSKQAALQSEVVEPRFEGITRLAALICGVATAMIAFPDKGNDWFSVGSGKIMIERFKGIDFFKHVVNGAAFFEVEDAPRDERFSKDKPMMEFFGICFYAAVPVTDQYGKIWGILSVSDSSPQKLTTSQVEALQLLAGEVNCLIENVELKMRVDRLASRRSAARGNKLTRAKKRMDHNEELNRIAVRKLLGAASNSQMLVDMMDGAAFDEESAVLFELLKKTSHTLKGTLVDFAGMLEARNPKAVRKNEVKNNVAYYRLLKQG